MFPDFAPPQTPALVIDVAALLRNLKTMQRAVLEGGVRLRPHGKMHKCSSLARLQIEAGAVGLCCQTVGEAEAFARGGIGDLLVSAPVPRWGPLRLAALVHETGVRLSVAVDSLAQIEALAAAAQGAGVELGATVDVNIGMHRVGCTPAEAPVLARAIAAAPALRYDGIQAYFGHLQHLSEGRAEANAAGTARLRTLVADLAAIGLSPSQITGGGTGTYALDIAGGVFTELQCGSYAVMDAEYQDCGGPEAVWPFDSALYIAASVVSARHKSHATIDCGLKSVSADVPPQIVGGAPFGSRYRSLGDEHGAVIHPSARSGDIDASDADPELAWPDDAPKEGDIVWLQPGHCDPTINLYDGFWAVDESSTAKWWPIDARRITTAAL